MAQVDSEFLPGVIKNNGKYEDIHAVRRAGKIDERCDYCYAKRHNWGRVTPSEVTDITERDFQNFKPKVIRIGKSSESLHPFYTPVLFKFLELCKKYDSRIIAPTKALSFGKQGIEGFVLKDVLSGFLPEGEEFAERLRKINAVINYSIGNDSFERGLASQGFTNLWRIQQALLYRQAGVNSTLTITCDVTSSLEDNSKRGFPVFQALKAGESGIPVRVLPLRIHSRKLAKTATGEDYFWLKKEPDMFHEAEARYVKRRNNELSPAFLHADFQELLKEGLGFCGQIGEMEYCDKCQVFVQNTRITFPITELARVEYSPEFYKNRKSLWGKRKKIGENQESSQISLFR